MPRGKRTSLPQAAQAKALADIGYQGTQIADATGLPVRTVDDIVYGILRDKERLDAGEPTAIIALHTQQEIEGLEALATVLGQTLLQSSGKTDRCDTKRKRHDYSQGPEVSTMLKPLCGPSIPTEIRLRNVNQLPTNSVPWFLRPYEVLGLER